MAKALGKKESQLIRGKRLARLLGGTSSMIQYHAYVANMVFPEISSGAGGYDLRFQYIIIIHG